MFIICNDSDFNHIIVIDMMDLFGNNIIYIIDMFTSYQAGGFVKKNSAEKTYKVIQSKWNNVLIGPAMYITYNLGTNFYSKRFKNKTKADRTTTQIQLVEMHNSVAYAERYYIVVQHIYKIFKDNHPELDKY
jgi:hypothetical protein